MKQAFQVIMMTNQLVKFWTAWDFLYERQVYSKSEIKELIHKETHYKMWHPIILSKKTVF